MEKLKVIIVDDDKLLGTTLVLGLEGLSMKPYYLDSLDTSVRDNELYLKAL